jgi:very-short-patch-repair endonuclease
VTAPHAVTYNNNLKGQKLNDLLESYEGPYVDVLVGPRSSNKVIDLAINSMAQATLDLWPDWYDLETVQSPLESLIDFDTNTSNMFKVLERASRIRDVEPLWLKNTLTKCVYNNQPPFFADYPKEIQVKQLTLALGHKYSGLKIIYSLEDVDSGSSLVETVKASQWLARNTGLEVIVFLPEELKAHPAINDLPIVDPPQKIKSEKSKGLSKGKIEGNNNPQPGKLEGHLDPIDFGLDGEDEDIEYTPHPFVVKEGVPNIQSPGELMLHNYISKSKSLSSLFQFNVPVIAYNKKRLIVDILWKEGKLIIEVDGYQFHGSQKAFIEDRNRDYILMLSGYRVLRLAHSEIIRSVQNAGEKIKNVVKYIKRHKKI